MAKKPCKIKVTLSSGDVVVPELGNQLVEEFGSTKGEEILRSVLSKDFYEYFGNFIANPKSELFKGKLDKEGMPLLEHVLKFKEEVFDNKKVNIKEKYLGKQVKDITDLRLKYVQKSVDTLLQQIKEFNRTKGAQEYVSNLNLLDSVLNSIATPVFFFSYLFTLFFTISFLRAFGTKILL